MYDMFVNAKQELIIQIKAGPCRGNTYAEGDKVVEDFSDGVYYSTEGVVVIYRGKVLWVTKAKPSVLPLGLKSFNKWGGFYNPAVDTLDAQNPMTKAVEAIARYYEGL